MRRCLAKGFFSAHATSMREAVTRVSGGCDLTADLSDKRRGRTAEVAAGKSPRQLEGGNVCCGWSYCFVVSAGGQRTELPVKGGPQRGPTDLSALEWHCLAHGPCGRRPLPARRRSGRSFLPFPFREPRGPVAGRSDSKPYPGRVVVFPLSSCLNQKNQNRIFRIFFPLAAGRICPAAKGKKAVDARWRRMTPAGHTTSNCGRHMLAWSRRIADPRPAADDCIKSP